MAYRTRQYSTNCREKKNHQLSLQNNANLYNKVSIILVFKCIRDLIKNDNNQFTQELTNNDNNNK